MPRASLYKYTPGQASPEELEATFVARHGLLDQLLVRTQQWCGGAAPEHTLLIGPRGMGKTHLLRLVAQRAAQTTPTCPLRIALFPEESYTVGSADELLLQVWARSGGVESPPTGTRAARTAWVLDQLRALHRQDGSRFLVLLDGFD